MANIERTVITSSLNHGLNDGDIIRVALPKADRLINLMTRPRMTYISAGISNTSFEIKQRRMTWNEWIGEMKQLFVDLIDDEIEAYEFELIYSKFEIMDMLY